MSISSLDRIVRNIKKRDHEEASEAYKAQVRDHFFNRLTRDNDNEKAILRHWGYAFNYTNDVLQTRWPAFEKVMRETEPKQDQLRARSAYNYAAYIVEERMPELEKHIATDAMAAVDYAKKVLGRAWNSDDEYGDIANRTIAKHPTPLITYEREIPQGRAMTPGM